MPSPRARTTSDSRTRRRRIRARYCPRRAVARRALERKTGARGLRSILEHNLLDIMYDLPSLKNVAKVVVDEAAINGESKPLLIYEGSDMPKAASD